MWNLSCISFFICYSSPSSLAFFFMDRGMLLETYVMCNHLVYLDRLGYFLLFLAVWKMTSTTLIKSLRHRGNYLTSQA